MRKWMIAAATAVAIVAPSIAHAQQRPDARSRPQASQQDARGWGDFRGALRNIAGARLNRAHVEREKPRQNEKNQKRR